MKYWVPGAIALALLCTLVGWVPTHEPGIEESITLPWWIVPMSPTIVFLALVGRRLLR